MQNSERDFPYVKAGIGAAFVAAAAIVGSCSYKIVPAQSYGVEIRAGQLINDSVKPGFHGVWPIYDDIYVFNNNTVIMTNTVGSGANTSDQNPLTVDLRTHYRVDPKVGLFALQVKNMGSDNGQSYVAGFETDSVNAVVGSRPATDTLSDPKGFLQAYLANFQWRLAQNNVPVRLDTVELLTMDIGKLRKPIQMKIRSNGEVEQMAGPAAVSVNYAGSTIPAQSPGVTVVAAPTRRDPTVSIAPNVTTVSAEPK